MTILGFIVLIFTLYTVGEVTINHGIEALFFLRALIPALMLIKPYTVPAMTRLESSA